MEYLFVLLMQVLETLDAVLDVGGVYDPPTDRYDHHQRGFDENFGHGFVTKLSSAGLVYKVEFSPFYAVLGNNILFCYSLPFANVPALLEVELVV
jgi:uncharacterized UPF0160 family protein